MSWLSACPFARQVLRSADEGEVLRERHAGREALRRHHAAISVHGGLLRFRWARLRSRATRCHELTRHEPGIEPLSIEQDAVIADLRDLALFEDDDVVGVSHRGES